MFLSNASACGSGSFDINIYPWCDIGCKYSSTIVGEFSEALYLELASLTLQHSPSFPFLSWV
jgi:hypothetical protein